MQRQAGSRRLFILWASLPVVSPVFAQQAPPLLPPVVVTATRMDTVVLDTPASVSVVEGYDMRSANLQINLSEGLAKVHPKWKTPYVVTAITGVIVAIGAAFFPVGQLADIANAGTLYAFLGAIGGAVLAFVISLDDVVIAEFVKSGGQDTLPTYMLGQIRRAISPEVNAISTAFLILSIGLTPTAYPLLPRHLTLAATFAGLIVTPTMPMDVMGGFSPWW